MLYPKAEIGNLLKTEKLAKGDDKWREQAARYNQKLITLNVK